MRRLEKVSSASAALALLPRIDCATRFSLRGLVRRSRATAFASVSVNVRGCAFLLIAPLLPLGLLVGRRVAVEEARRRELAEAVADHVLGHQNRQELVAVIDAEGQADELRQDGRATRPGLDDLVAARAARRLGLLQQISVDERTLPYGACHCA